MGDFNYPGIDWDMQLACDDATAEEKNVCGMFDG